MSLPDSPGIPKRVLGRTGQNVSVLGYGTAELRGPNWRWSGRSISPEHARQILHAVLDAGVNLIDTSIDYGTSEELIGKYLAGRRHEYFLASKCGCLTDPADFVPENRGKHVFTRANITTGVEQSLRRLQTDYLDLIQFHGSPTRQILENEDAIQTLTDLKRAGKVRWIGSSSILPNIVDHIEMGVFDVFQIPYSAVERTHEEFISAAASAGAGVIIRGGLAQGMSEQFAHVGQRPTRQGVQSSKETWGNARLDDLLDGTGRMEFLARFAITHAHVHSVLVGTINLQHFMENVNAMRKGPLPLELYAEAKLRLNAAG